MARIRSIKPELPQSESMGKISRDARLLFILTWTLADDEGRLRGNSRMLASLLFPYDNDAPGLIDGWIGELVTEGCVQIYSVDGSTYMQIAKWLNHQKIDKPSKSKIPEFVESSRILANPRGGIKDQGSKDQGSEEGRGSACAEPQSDSTPADSQVGLDDMPGFGGELFGDLPAAAVANVANSVEPAVLIMPLVGKNEFGITQAQIDEWTGAYPGVDVIRQLAAMRQWCLANPNRRKTQRGVLAFCNSWLMREQDRAAPQQVRTVPRQLQGAPVDLAAAQRAANEEAKRRLGFSFGGGEVIDAAP